MYDMKNLSKLKQLDALAPAMKAYRELNATAMAEGAIPVKYKELMAVAVALTTQCPYCLEVHTQRARAAGATDAELAETVLVATALRAGAAVTHGTHCFS
jgi:AhpD family alkylhydroperoxidase